MHIADVEPMGEALTTVSMPRLTLLQALRLLSSHGNLEFSGFSRLSTQQIYKALPNKSLPI